MTSSANRIHILESFKIRLDEKQAYVSHTRKQCCFVSACFFMHAKLNVQDIYECTICRVSRIMNILCRSLDIQC